MSRFVTVAVLVFIGCDQPNNAVAPIIQESNEAKESTFDADSFDIDQHLGEVKNVEAVLEGDFVLARALMKDFVGQSPADLKASGKPFKEGDAIQIFFHSVPLAVAGESEEVRQQLLKEVGNRVRLNGRITRLQVEARGAHNPPQGQQGSSGPIRAHNVYYLIVSSCEPLDAGSSQEVKP